MASNMSICIQPYLQLKTDTKHTMHAIPMNRLNRIQQAEIKKAPQFIYAERAPERKNLTLSLSAKAYSDNSDINVTPYSPGNIVTLFYSAINEKNLRQLDKLLDEDCLFEDYSFPRSFQGKKEVLNFLKNLISCMGQNMQFNIDHICEGDDFTVAVNWHLDWNHIQVPFTRGCSSYSLSIDTDNLVIKKAQVLIESPIKLAGVALTTFRIVTSLFDAFPAATERILKSPHLLFHPLINTYKITVRPIISPFLAWYIKLLNIAAIIVRFTLKMLYCLAKLFHM